MRGKDKIVRIEGGWKRTPGVEHALDDLAPQSRLAEHHELEAIARDERDVLSLIHDPSLRSETANRWQVELQKIIQGSDEARGRNQIVARCLGVARTTW